MTYDVSNINSGAPNHYFKQVQGYDYKKKKKKKKKKRAAAMLVAQGKTIEMASRTRWKRREIRKLYIIRTS
jgi:hypothetical protein